VAALALLLSPGLLATVMVEIPLEQMAREADAVVHGRVLRVGTQLRAEADGVEPHTITVIQVTEFLKGSGPALISIDELGGHALDRGLRVDGTPAFHRGEEVILFLRRHGKRADTFRTFGMAQGKFTVLPGVRPGLSVARQQLAGLSLQRDHRDETSLQRAPHAVSLQLDALVGMVRSIGIEVGR